VRTTPALEALLDQAAEQQTLAARAAY